MKIYIASSVNNKDIVMKWVEKIGKEPNIEITYNWATHGRISDPIEQRQVAVKEVIGVQRADLLLVLLPGGWGTHVEMGVALGLQKPIFLVSLNEKATDYMDPDGKTCTFHEHPNVKKIKKHDIVDEIKWIAHLQELEPMDAQNFIQVDTLSIYDKT